jgi:hypothetical protein
VVPTGAIDEPTNQQLLHRPAQYPVPRVPITRARSESLSNGNVGKGVKGPFEATLQCLADMTAGVQDVILVSCCRKGVTKNLKYPDTSKLEQQYHRSSKPCGGPDESAVAPATRFRHSQEPAKRLMSNKLATRMATQLFDTALRAHTKHSSSIVFGSSHCNPLLGLPNSHITAQGSRLL